MSDTEGPPSSTPPGEPAAKKKTPSRSPPGPGVSQLIVRAVAASKDRNGVSLAAFRKVLAVGGYDVDKNNSRIKTAIKSLVSKGVLVQVKGTGVTGSFKINKKHHDARDKPKARKIDKPKKPAAKKVAKSPKKPAAAKKKSAPAKRPIKSPKKPKAAAKPKRPTATKEAAKPKKAAKSPAKKAAKQRKR